MPRQGGAWGGELPRRRASPLASPRPHTPARPQMTRDRDQRLVEKETTHPTPSSIQMTRDRKKRLIADLEQTVTDLESKNSTRRKVSRAKATPPRAPQRLSRSLQPPPTHPTPHTPPPGPRLDAGSQLVAQQPHPIRRAVRGDRRRAQQHALRRVVRSGEARPGRRGRARLRRRGEVRPGRLGQARAR